MATKSKELLERYIKEALKLLDTNGEFVTTGNKLALMDMVEQARAALEGRKSVPHIRNREFYKPRPEEEILFATERYTMAPTYLEDKVYQMYGLKPAIEWFKTKDIRYGLNHIDTLEVRAKKVIQQCYEFLETASYGDKVGEYESELGEELVEKLHSLKGFKGEELAKEIINCQNALREVKFSQVLRSELEKDFNIFISEEELETIRHGIKEDSVIKEQYEQIRSIADEATLEQRKRAYELIFEEEDYTYLNQNYTMWMTKSQLERFNQGQDKNKQSVLWSSTGTVASFMAPAEAVGASITFVLPSAENEKEGLGHVWIDNVELLSAIGPNVDICNPGFEECVEADRKDGKRSGKTPVRWRAKAKKGNPLMCVEENPPYQYFDDKIGTPPFGDHKLTDGSEFGIYGLYINTIEKIDKNLADKMYTTWARAGKPIKRFWGESLAIDNLLYVGDDYKVASNFKFHLESTSAFINAGIYMFRKNFGKKDESYFAIMSSPKHIGHGHLDQGSFILYKDSIPIIMDSGIEGYFDASTPWHISSYSHACVQFETKRTAEGMKENGFINLSAGSYSLKRGWVDVPRTSKVAECIVGEDIEKIVIEIKNGEGAGTHVRTVLYYRKWDLYIIRDEIKDFTGKVLMTLPVVSKESLIEGNTIYSKGYYHIDLQTVIASPYKNILLDRGRTTPVYPSIEKVPMLEYIRVTADAKEGFLTVLYPKAKELGENIEVVTASSGWEIWLRGEKIAEINKN